MGATYKDAIGILTKRFGVPGRVLAEDPAHGRNATEVEWADDTVHVRAIDRSSENIAGLVFKDAQAPREWRRLRPNSRAKRAV